MGNMEEQSKIIRKQEVLIEEMKQYIDMKISIRLGRINLQWIKK